MGKQLRNFVQDDSGAVTVDWVVLTAALVGLSALVVLTIAGAALDSGTGVGAHLENSTINSTY
jgi:Flp pilus assembly pilin Flp